MRYFILAIAAIITLNFTSCKETDAAKNDVTNEKMKDTLNKLYPSLLQGHVNVEIHDFREARVLLGDKELFAKPDNEKEEIVKTISELIYQLYHENNYLDEGKVTFVPVEDRMPNDSDPKKEYDMHISDVVKAHEK